MALNWGDVALNFTAGAIDKSEQYRKEELEQRFNISGIEEKASRKINS